MDEKSIKILKQPFEGSQLRTRKGKSGMTFTYVDGALVVERLNEAFGHRWSWAILEWAMRPIEGGSNDVKVQGRLTVKDGDELITKDAWGGVLVRPNSMDCEADMLKAASTDALKKAASLFGVALHLYSDEVDTGDDEPRRDEPKRERTQSQQSKPPTSKGQQKGGASTAKPPARLSGEQSARIATLIADVGMPEDVLTDKVKTKYGVKPEQLSPEQAAAVIDYLEQVKARNSGEKGKAA